MRVGRATAGITAAPARGLPAVGDPELQMYYTGTANAYPYTPHSERMGRGGGDYDNVGAAAVVAVDTATGKVAWRYTVVPGDPYDYDTMQTPLVITIDGRKTVVQPNKTGFISYLDAATGKFLKAPAFSDRITWASGYTDDGKPIWTQTIPQEGEDPIEVWPSLLGGVNMYPAAYNPATGMIYLAAREMGMLWGFEKVQTTSNVQLVGATFELPPGGYELNKAVGRGNRGGNLARPEIQGRLLRRHADHRRRPGHVRRRRRHRARRGCLHG